MFLKKMMFALFLLLAVGAHAQQVKLVLKKGDSYETIVTTKVNSVMNIMGQETENNINTSTTEKTEVKNSSPNQADLVLTTTHLQATTNMAGSESTYDSDKKDNSSRGTEEFDKLINKPKTITVDASGKIIKTDGAGEAANPLDIVPKNNITLFQEKLVGKNIKTGESWLDSTSSGDQKLTTKTNGTFIVKGTDNSIATIVFAGTINMTGTVEQMGMEMEIQSTSNMTSEVKLDINTGIILESNSTVDGVMMLGSGSVKIPVTTKTITTLKTRKL